MWHQGVVTRPSATMWPSTKQRYFLPIFSALRGRAQVLKGLRSSCYEHQARSVRVESVNKTRLALGETYFGRLGKARNDPVCEGPRFLGTQTVGGHSRGLFHDHKQGIFTPELQGFSCLRGGRKVLGRRRCQELNFGADLQRIAFACPTAVDPHLAGFEHRTHAGSGRARVRPRRGSDRGDGQRVRPRPRIPCAARCLLRSSALQAWDCHQSSRCLNLPTELAFPRHPRLHPSACGPQTPDAGPWKQCNCAA